ncbi:type II CRISPR RNA-guided endonuclease Cas9, partial [bacterium]|nr:type II CRISPR RNA-guided endonuclease Cas9 [bacterium]
MPRLKTSDLVLGLDIGTNSIGWALLREDGDDKPCEIVHAGVRIFEAGVEGMEKDGRGDPRNKTRRDARGVRRRLERRARRKSVLFHRLQKVGLLPPTPEHLDPLIDPRKPNRAQERHSVIQPLDRKLLSEWPERFGEEADPALLPYMLRARALDDKLERHELGRALYHLAQRRGFKSNRKADRDEKDEGVVKEGISDLHKRMKETGARTLGEFFAKRDPHLRRIRQQWTARAMFEDEFEQIWRAQVPHHPDLLSDDLKKTIIDATFKQRPLKSQKHLIGKCELEKDRHRAPWCCLDAQRFRFLQRVNDLEIYMEGEIPRPLTQDEREAVIALLESKASATFRQIAKVIGQRKAHFNLEHGGEKSLPGNKTASHMRKVFGDRWNHFSHGEQSAIIDDLHSIEKPETATKRGIEAYGLDEETAGVFSVLRLEEGYCNFSRKALRRLLPELEKGMRLQAAIKQIYNVQQEVKDPLDMLPPLQDVLTELRNPVVARALSELRKVVNAIVRKYGKPKRIRIELARDVRNSPKRRQDIIKRNRDNEKVREKATAILVDYGIGNPSRNDVMKYLLAEESRWLCPYTGKQISMDALFGPNPQFDIEHIIPYERSLDNSYMNKTLCELHENRHVKQGRTPYETYASNTETWSAILTRISGISGLPRGKVWRFTMDDDEIERFLEDFTHQQLTDTAYASRLAAQYLGCLYGGDIDADRKRRIHVVNGRATWIIRNELDLNAILGDGGLKSRNDHRHHAVDAIVIAMTTPGMIKNLSRAAQAAAKSGIRTYGLVEKPWDTFWRDANIAIEDIIVSHRVDHRVQGGLHEESFYSPSRNEDGVIEDGGKYVHIRKPLVSLTGKDIDNIVDPVVRELVREAADGVAPSKVFSDAAKMPAYPGGNDKPRTIKKVRIRKAQSTLKMGSGGGARYVAAGSNHHIEIL